MADEEWTQLEEYCLVEEVCDEPLEKVDDVQDEPPDMVEELPDKPLDSDKEVPDEFSDKPSGTDNIVEMKRQSHNAEDKMDDASTEDEKDKTDAEEQNQEIMYNVIEGSSQRLRPKLVDSRGFTYTQYSKNKDGSITWRCTIRNPKMFCGTLVKQVDDEFYLGKKDHCHPGSPNQFTIDTIKSQVKLAATSHLFEPAAEIINSVLRCNVSEAQETSLPKAHSLVRTANRIRQKLFPPNPNNIKFVLDLDAIPDYFLMKDVKSRNRRHLIFSTPNQQVLLARASRWYMDTTPKVIKEPFTQLVGIHSFLKKQDDVRQMPLVYILMTGKTHRDYKSVFGAIRGLLPEDICLEEILTDFEPELWGALKVVFPDVAIKGCYSHWQQAIWTKAKEFGLPQVDRKRKEVFSILQDIMGLPFLPPSLIPPMLETLRNEADLPVLQTVFDYVASTWVDTELWPPNTWSCYNQSLRPSSDCENWHQQLKTKASRSKVALYPLIQLLYMEAKSVDIRVRLASEKKVQRHQRKSLGSTQGRVYRFWREYDEGTRTAKALLRDCAHVQGNAPMRAFKHGRRRSKLRSLGGASIRDNVPPRTEEEGMRGEDLLLQACTTILKNVHSVTPALILSKGTEGSWKGTMSIFPSKDLTSSDVPDDLDFSLLELGSTGQVATVPGRDPKFGPPPLATLPNGLPPVLQDFKTKTLQFLNRPEKLPIHDVKSAQRFWPRTTDPSSLYEAFLCPVQTTLQVERHPTTGELTGFKEVQMENTASTAKNSLSLRRQPGPPTQSVRGSTINFPFWPGGMDEPSVETIRTRQDDEEEIDFDNDLLSTPPGLANGMEFEKKPTAGLVEETVRPPASTPQAPPSHILKLTDLMVIDDGDEFAFSENEESSEEEGFEEEREIIRKETEEKVEEVVDEGLDKMLPKEAIQIPKQPRLNEAEETKEQWAVNVDVSSPVSDFHKRVPAPAKQWPFELDVFQKQAVIHLENHDCVFVAAHTSAGKTVVAEYAIALALKHLTKAVYTSPIKALSNQKFRDFKDTFEDVGLLTGDVQIKTDASCLIMTTEILRSMLYNGSDVIRDLEWVIFDEVHYINDSERGVVWEEVFIMLPDHVKIILLSATVPNTVEFADWVGRIKRKKIYVISTLKRPVPLEHYLYTGNSTKTNKELFLLVDSTKTFLTSGYHKAIDAKKERESKASASFGAKGPRQAPHKGDKGVYLSVIEMLRKKEQLPVVAFTFSKKRCDENAFMLTTIDLTTTNEKSEIHVFAQKCIERLKGSDRKLPQVLHMRDLLKRGIGVHHSGILPILKEMIEMLFQRGLVKLLFATETFAMGVNMPARTVIFDSIRKFDGSGPRTLLAGEYIQMAGRAGRRGLDTTGMVILLCKGDVPEAGELHKMMLGKPTRLESQFRLTYTMILNLLCVEKLRMEDMMKRSFSESNTRKDSKEYERQLRAVQEEMGAVQELNCYLCNADMENYYHTCKELQGLRTKLGKLIASHPLGVKALSTGRVVIVSTKKYHNALGVILGSSTASKERTFKALVLCNQENTGGTIAQQQSQKFHVEPLRKEPLFHPDGPCGHAVVDLVGSEIGTVTTTTIKVNSDRIVKDFEKRQIPRFRDDPPGQSTSIATQELLRLTEANPDGLDALDPVKDLHLRELEQVEKFREKATLEGLLEQFGCLNCPNFLEHFGVMCHRMKLKEDCRHLRYLLSDQSLHLLPEYNQRIEVLQRLRHIDTSNTIQLKGRVAREISNHELIITELVFQSLLTGLPPAEIAALLSCMVFQEKRCNEPELTPSLKEGVGKIKAEAKRLAEIQHKCGIRLSTEDYVAQFRFGLTQVVYEWARGMPFSDITNLTDVSEGIIVRTIQRLDEVCRDVRSAARIVGDPSLFQKMDEASQLIKRDIVFAASLYTQ